MVAIKKKEFNLEEFTDEHGSDTEYKPESYLDCGEAFLDACGVPGPAMGHINMFLGHSNTGKTTALLASAASAQKKGILPIFIITEQKWSFEHAQLMGLDCKKITDPTSPKFGKWVGDFLFKDGFDYIEQISDFINKMLDLQNQGKLPRDLCFFWDSIGSVPCKMTFEGKGGKQHTAGVLADKFEMGINQRINSSRKAGAKYTNGLVICNLPWVERPAPGQTGQPKIKPKGGEAISQIATFQFRFGNEANAGISFINATRNGRKINYATRSKVTLFKNHITGLGYADSQIVVTPHGFIAADKKGSSTNLNKYKESTKSYWAERLGGTDFDLIEENNAPITDDSLDFEDEA